MVIKQAAMDQWPSGHQRLGNRKLSRNGTKGPNNKGQENRSPESQATCVGLVPYLTMPRQARDTGVTLADWRQCNNYAFRSIIVTQALRNQHRCRVYN